MKLIFEYLTAYPILWAPIVALAAYLICLVLRLTAQKRCKKAPGAVSEKTLKNYKTCSKVFGAIAIITWVVIGGGAFLLYKAVEFM